MMKYATLCLLFIVLLGCNHESLSNISEQECSTTVQSQPLLKNIVQAIDEYNAFKQVRLLIASPDQSSYKHGNCIKLDDNSIENQFIIDNLNIYSVISLKKTD